jgi:uncharacterized protein (TIGR02453 family)
MFPGFPRELPGFFQDLRLHNDRAWFAANKERYEREVLEPSKLFVLAMGERLMAVAPGVQADPRVNRSLFRLQRDTRFANDKSPYKTNLGLWLWEGVGPRMACSGFYLHVEPPTLMLGVGLYQFPEPLLEAFRESVLSDVHGPALVEAAGRVTAAGPYTLGGRTWKRTPRGYDKAHPRADWLTFGGLYAGLEVPLPAVFHEPGFPDFCAVHYQKMLPLHAWLLDLTRRA